MTGKSCATSDIEVKGEMSTRPATSRKRLAISTATPVPIERPGSLLDTDDNDGMQRDLLLEDQVIHQSVCIIDDVAFDCFAAGVLVEAVARVLEGDHVELGSRNYLVLKVQEVQHDEHVAEVFCVAVEVHQRDPRLASVFLQLLLFGLVR